MAECNRCSGSCCGGCGGCGSCAGSISLTEGELHILKKLEQIPFLPVARKADTEDPVYLEDDDYTVKEYSLILLCLEKKGLITLDYHIPLKGLNSSAYSNYPIQGSFALTQRGQQVLEVLDLLGTN